MTRVYVLFRCDGAGSPYVHHIGAFKHWTEAKDAAHEIEGVLEWPENQATDGIWLADASGGATGAWELYGIVRFDIDDTE